eukprot:6725-Prymnesium_polylepis.1
MLQRDLASNDLSLTPIARFPGTVNGISCQGNGLEAQRTAQPCTRCPSPAPAPNRAHSMRGA